MNKKYLLGFAAVIGFIAVVIIVANLTATDPLEEEAMADTTTTSTTSSTEEIIEITSGTAELTETQTAEILTSAAIENVPLINQLDSPRLRNGCEVTSLAMMLNYYNIEVSKNELADALPSVAYQDEEGYYGDPNEGFVGDITGDIGAGYFVYHEPIFNLAQNYLTEDLTAIDFTGSDFSKVQYFLSTGSPVWAITTTNYAATNDLETWETVNGPVEISMSEHCVVLIGYDEEYVYLNDPYGNENYQTSLTDFVASWEQFGSQAIAITEA
ncbi:C39 family peptidase [Enterococcus sp. LJL90]